LEIKRKTKNMALQTFSLKLEGLIFPNFGKDNSKKNFRLMIDVNFFDKDGTPATTHISFPAEEIWQWRTADKKFFFPTKTVTATAAELDFSVFTSNTAEFSETDVEFLVSQGKLHSIVVHIIDVFDKSFADHLKDIAKNALPILIDAATGGVVKLIGNKLVGTIIGQFKGDDITTEILKKVGGKDKILFKGGKFQSSFGKISIGGKGVFKNKNDMSGDYKVALSYTEIKI